MYSYYSPNYSPSRTPEDMDYIDSRRKNFSNPKLQTKTKVITRRTYLDGEKIKEKRNYNLYQSGHGKTESIVKEYREEDDEQPYEVVRNQPNTDYYEKYEEYKNCKNNDGYGYCSDYDKYGNSGTYEEYRSSGNYGDLGKCGNYENYESYNIKTCKNYKDYGGCKKFKCKKSCCSPCCYPNCHCRRVKHYKKCRKTKNYDDCGDNYVEDYRYVKNYNNCGLGQNYEYYKCDDYENYDNCEKLGNSNGVIKNTSVKREVIHMPTQVYTSPPKIRRYGDYESYQIDTETKDEDVINEVKRVESIVDNYNYKETKHIHDPRLKALVIHRRKCSPTKSVKYLYNQERNLRNNKSSKCYEKRREPERLPVQPPYQHMQLSYYKNKNKSCKYIQPSTHKEVIEKVEKSYVMPPKQKKVVEKTVINYNDEDENEVAEEGCQTHFADDQYIVKTKKVIKNTENIVEDQNYNTVVAAPQEKVYTTKYVFKKNIYEEEDTN